MRRFPTKGCICLHLPAGMGEEAFELLAEEDLRVIWADLNFEGHAPGGSTQSFFFHVNPTSYVSQYSWDKISLPATRKVATGRGHTVALLIRASDATHESLVGHLSDQGYNFVDSKPHRR